MDAQIMDNTVSSTSTNNDEQTRVCANIRFHEIQVNEVSSTTSSDVEAIMLSLLGFD